MGEVLARRGQLDALEVPREVWRRSSRPVRGQGIRLGIGLAFMFAALLAPALPVKVVLIAVGVGLAAALPMLVDGWLEKQAAQIGDTSRSKATGVLTGLENRRLVALFAPHAWVQVQKGRLHLILEDGRAAARAFAEAARLVGDVKQPLLVGGQALGLTMSGDRKDARALLVALEEANDLAPADKLSLGIVYVEEPGRVDRAVALIEGARDTFGSHPRVMAALALAYARADRLEDARAALDVAEADDEVLAADALAPDLLKRARKDLRQADDGGTKRAGKAKSADARSGGRKKKDRRKDRRKKRKQRKAQAEDGSEDDGSQDDASDEGLGDDDGADDERDDDVSGEMSRDELANLFGDGAPEPEPEEPEPAKDDDDDSLEQRWSQDDYARAEAIAAAMQEENSDVTPLPVTPEDAEPPAPARPEPPGKKAVTFEGNKPLFAPPPPVTGPRAPKPPVLGKPVAPRTKPSAKTGSKSES